MPRISRMIVAEEKAVYHVMSRTALDGFPLKDVENEQLDQKSRLQAIGVELNDLFSKSFT